MLSLYSGLKRVEHWEMKAPWFCNNLFFSQVIKIYMCPFHIIESLQLNTFGDFMHYDSFH